jgi:glutamyl-tRNA synthetase
MSVRVRFAPSPTGYLHVGGARTALFNWLFARQHHGAFILRIEDTDEKRSSEEMVQGILSGLRWLGLDWDEGPFFQSERGELYQEAVRKLLESNAAYRDFSPPEAGEGAYQVWRELDPEESLRRAGAGQPFAVRFRVPPGRVISFVDAVFGPVTVDSSTLDDFVILRSDGSPTYHLSVVADDADMRISHVIRGSDHLPNTPKHVLLFEGLNQPAPHFAHLPLILGPDKKRLSKRHGATSVTEFSRQGLIPDAVRNYLALLGWSPGDDSELLTTEELIRRFDLSRVNKANAVFDYSKLDWMNKRHLSTLEARALEPLVRTTLDQRGLWNSAWESQDRPWLYSVIDLLKSRVQNLNDFADYGRPFWTDDFGYEPEALARFIDSAGREKIAALLEILKDRLASLSVFDTASTETVLRGLAAESGLKAGEVIGAVRVAVTGRAQAPGLFDVLVVLGRERVLQRLDRMVRFLRHG